MSESNMSLAGNPGMTFGRAQSRGEELANSITHGAGFVAAIAGTPFLIVHAARLGHAGYLIGASVFAVTVMILYLSSTIYHALRPGGAKHVFRILEHSAIFLLIAGTYTPFTLGALYGPWGWTLFGMIWALAVIGVTLKVVNGTSHPVAFTILYLLMGWLILIAIDPLYTLIPESGLIWLVAGGLAYTAGLIFYVADSRVPYGHCIWHLFVLAGTTCHYCAVFWYAA